MNKECTESQETQNEFKEPSLYQVNMLKDDFTPRDFIVSVLETFFFMERPRAAEVELDMKAKGKGVCGVFTKDYALSKIYQVIEYAERHGHPLNCSMEIA